MSEVITIQDLETLKKHEIFEAEVITGLVGGLSTGAYLATATNPVTGQMQDTLPQILSDLGMQVQSWPASVGGVLTSPSQIFLDDIMGSLGIGDYYAWGGPFPKTVPPGTDPAVPGSGYIPRSDKFVKASAREALRRSYAEAGYILVSGSFESGGTLTSGTDVLLYENNGKAYTGAGPFPQIVPPGSTPVAGFIDQSSSLLKPSVDLLRSDFDEYSHNDTNQRIGNGVLITAHRNGGVGTENSIMNYQKMMETGMYDGIELDMCISADGVLYNFHDRDVSLQTNGTGLFYELNSSYIDTLRYTATEGTSIAGDQIPKLHEVLRVAADFDCWVNAEIKFMRMDGGVDRYTDIHIMIDALKDAGVFEKCMLGAFDINYLTTAINYDKFSSINRYIFQGEYTNSAVDQLAALPSKGLKFMSLFYTDFTPAIAEYMRSKGVIPGVWTPNDPMQQETAIADGARIINSDAWGLGNLGGKK